MLLLLLRVLLRSPWGYAFTIRVKFLPRLCSNVNIRLPVMSIDKSVITTSGTPMALTSGHTSSLFRDIWNANHQPGTAWKFAWIGSRDGKTAAELLCSSYFFLFFLHMLSIHFFMISWVHHCLSLWHNVESILKYIFIMLTQAKFTSRNASDILSDVVAFNTF